MKRLAVVALIVAIVALLVSVAAFWQAWDDDDSSPSRTTSSGGRSTTTTIPLVVVPSQAGKNVMLAASDLQKVGLGFAIVYSPSVTTGRDRVISQHPVETTRVPKGTEVTLVASSGTP